jgi:hypothetical protein
MTPQEERCEGRCANDRTVAETLGEIRRAPLFYPAAAVITALILLIMAAV